MSKDKYKHAMEIIENWERVEIGFGYPERSWNEAKQSPDSFTLSQLNDRALFRLKPTPSKAPFGPEDIKPGMVFRCQGNGNSESQWSTKSRHGLMFSGTQFSWKGLQQHAEWSDDCITWHPCEKPSQPPPKREPRRVWVNIYPSEPTLPTCVSHPSKEEAIRSASKAVDEVAVEFVEVVK